MKLLLTLAMVFSLSQAYAQMMGAPATTITPATNSTMPGMMNNNNNANQPTFGNRVRNTGTTGNVRNNNINNTNTTTDTIGTSQSSTTRTVLPNTPGTITPANTAPVNCVDSSGRNYGSRDSGYAACVNSMRMR